MGIPDNINSDRAIEFCGRESSYIKLAKGKQINLTYSEPECSNEIYNVDISIRDINNFCHPKMVSNNFPRGVWYFYLKNAAKVTQMIPSAKINGRTPIEAVTGETPDFSDYTDFDFYDLVWYHTGKHPSISKDRRELGRWMVVAHRVGSNMSYWIIPISGQSIAETTV